MPTTVVRYVNTASAAGGDGTTNDTVGATRAYHSLEDALAAATKDLVAADQVWKIICSGGLDGTSARITDGWVTDLTRYLWLTVDEGSRHAGYWDESKYHIAVVDNDALYNTSTGAAYLRIEGFLLKVDATVGGTTRRCLRLVGPSGTGLCVVDSVFTRLAMATGVIDVMYGIGVSGGTSIAYRFSNCITWGVLADGYATQGARGFNIPDSVAAGTRIYNCLSYGNRRGYDMGTSGVVVKNNIAQNNFDGFTATYGAGSDYNVSDDNDAPGPNSRNSVVVQFLDAASGDFRLSPADTEAQDHGSTLIVDPVLPLTTDITGATRQDPWDAGPYDVAANTPTYPTDWETIDTLGAATDVYEDDTAEPDAVYEYRVVAINDAGESTSNVVEADTTATIVSGTAAVSAGGAVAVQSGKVAASSASISTATAGVVIGRKSSGTTAAISAGGAVNSIAAKIAAGTVAVSATGTAVAAGRKVRVATAAVSAAIATVATGRKQAVVLLVVSASGTTSVASGAETRTVAAQVSGTGALAVTARRWTSGTLQVTAGSAVTVAPSRTVHAIIPIAAGGTLAVAGRHTSRAVLELSLGGQVQSWGIRTAVVVLSISGTGSIVTTRAAVTNSGLLLGARSSTPAYLSARSSHLKHLDQRSSHHKYSNARGW